MEQGRMEAGEGAFAWWQRGIVYEVYPRSFQDSNGDGIGDINGIRQRLPYLQWLGVDALWIPPVYTSPMADFGYDVSNYCDIEPMFGTLADMDALIADAHERGIRIILDFVPNHTSDQHSWFVQSRSSRDNPYRDWYIWRDAKPDGSPPSNWWAHLGGIAWTLDEASGQYYLHSFLPQQPDLNWRNPAVLQALKQQLRFWLERGVDGFRMDALMHLYKDEQFRDNPPNPDWLPDKQAEHDQVIPLYTLNLPENLQAVAAFRSLLDEFDGDRMMLGEVYLSTKDLVAYYGERGHGVQMPTNTSLILHAFEPAQIKEDIRDYELALPVFAWPNWSFGNHDRPRFATRAGQDHARLGAMLLLTLRGTPIIYYGDELGMADVPVAPENLQDPFEKRSPGKGLGRDPVRSPMRWDGSEHAGFSTAKPWLPVGDGYQALNVQQAQAEPHSLLNLYQRLISLRRTHIALAVGSITLLEAPADIVAYVREHAGQRIAVVLNFSAHARAYAHPLLANARLLMTTDGLEDHFGNAVKLSALNGAILQLPEAPPIPVLL